jgi:aerobic-type carbon monoxide dehydrogenase small subunit (CoxS/CutS family)
MTRNLKRKEGSSPARVEKRDQKAVKTPAGTTRGVISEVANTKVDRRTLLKGTTAAAAVLGVSAVALRQRETREQSSQSYTTISPTATNTAVPPGATPIVATDPFALRTITINVNGKDYTINVEPRRMLVDVLREDLGMIATKRPCDRMCCGSCTVLIDGIPHESCSYMAVRAVGHSIVTSEITTGDPVVNALQQAWPVADGGQCCYCASGMIMASTYLLKNNPNPSVADIKAALSGNLCRCGNYLHTIEAVQLAATNLGGA